MKKVQNGFYLVPFAIIAATLSKVTNTFIFTCLFICWLIYLFWKQAFPRFVLFMSSIAAMIFLLYIPNPFEAEFVREYKDNTFYGSIVSMVENNNNRTSFVFKDKKSKNKYQVVYFQESFENEDHILHHGSTCVIKGKSADTARATNPGQFDYELYLKKQGIQGELIVEKNSDIQCIGRSLVSYIHAWRMDVLNKIDERFDERSSRWMKALLFGERAYLEKEVVEQFQDWGLAHLLAISGLHIGIILGVIYLVLVRSNMTTKETAQTILICSLPFYIILAGGSASVWRGILTVVVLLLFDKFKRNISLPDVFSIVFTLLILFDPYQIYDIGFQFSFLVTFGIILSQGWLKVNSYFFQALRLSYISQMVITPLQLLYFKQFQPLGMLLNVAIVPYFSIVFLPFILFMFFCGMLIPPFIPALEGVFYPLEIIMVRAVGFLDSLIHFTVSIGEVSFMYILGYYIVLFLSMFYLEKQKELIGFIWSILLVIQLVVPSALPYFKNEGIVTMLDVGQSDTLVIELPKKEGVILYDAGAIFSFQNEEVSRRIYEQVIKPFFNHQQITKIDCIFISHEDLDHDGSIPFILEDYDVEQIVVSPYYKPDVRVKKSFEEAGVSVEVMRPGDVFQLGEYRFQALSPFQDTNSANENSLVLQANLGGANWLFTGDIGKEMESKLMKAYPKLQVDVLRVGHHGSKNSTSEAFLEHIKPRYALISSGRNNRYGHPATEVLDLLDENEVKVLRTDENGAVQFRFSEDNGTFIPFLQ